MKISMEEKKWEEDNFKMHKEGFGKIDDDDKFFTFTYYQWCAFFFLFQVRIFCFLLLVKPRKDLFLSRQPVSQLPG